MHLDCMTSGSALLHVEHVHCSLYSMFYALVSSASTSLIVLRTAASHGDLLA